MPSSLPRPTPFHHPEAKISATYSPTAPCTIRMPRSLPRSAHRRPPR
jgi:hypothetical protein